MIITLFAILVAIALVLMVLGLATDNPIFSIGGAALFLVISGIILTGEGITYKTGENITIITNEDNTTSQTVNDVYGSYDDSTTNQYGWILLILGIAAVAYSLFTIGD